MTFDWTISITTILAGAGAVGGVIVAGWNMVTRICDRLDGIERGAILLAERMEVMGKQIERLQEHYERRTEGR